MSPLPDPHPALAVHLVDDEAPVRDALAFLFMSHGLASRAYDSGPAFLRAVNAGSVCGCILLDVRMEPMSGLQVHGELKARGLRWPVIFLTGHGDIPMAVDALHNGAFDFIEKPFSDTALVERVKRALDVAGAQLASRAAGDERDARLASLTEREREVMHRVAAGRLNKVIADELNISVRTVEVHRARVFAKLGVRSAAEVATLLAQGG
jgi:two-component system, LuxR family, response regulator DctR